MVIQNSESNTTLVSLSDEKDRLSNENIVLGKSGLLEYARSSSSTSTSTSAPTATACHAHGGVATELRIPALDSEEKHVPLYLPAAQALEDVDGYLSRNYYGIHSRERERECKNKLLQEPEMRAGADALRESRRRLLSNPLRRMQANESDRVLYVAQGERANATAGEYDVLMSDQATTCHILAFRSTTGEDNGDESHYASGDAPLTSLTHLDGTHYEGCVRDMIQEHIDHHRKRGNTWMGTSDVQEEKESDDPCKSESSTNKIVTIDVHVMGGFFDKKMASSKTTEWLLRLLARLAKELAHQGVGVRLVVKTLVVSSSNSQLDDSYNESPIGRGLGIDAWTGEVFLAQCDGRNSSSGPAPLLRSARLWCREASEPHKLSVVHTVRDLDDFFSSYQINEDHPIRSECSFFWVQPFAFRSIPCADALLSLTNEQFLKEMSTSPEVEEPSFCDDVRASLRFLTERCDVECDDGSSMFGTNLDRPLLFVMCHRRSTAQFARGKWTRVSL